MLLHSHLLFFDISPLSLSGEYLPPAHPRGPDAEKKDYGGHFFYVRVSVCEVPGVKSCVGEGGGPLLCAGEMDDAAHEDDHQGEDQEEDAGNPTLNHRDQIASQHQTQTSHRHQAHN